MRVIYIMDVCEPIDRFKQNLIQIMYKILCKTDSTYTNNIQ